MEVKRDFEFWVRINEKVLLGGALIAVFLLGIFEVTCPDSWWHLKTGEYIIRNQTIPRKDIFSHTITGKCWITFEWLFQVLLYGIYNLFNIKGIILFKALLITLSFFILTRLQKVYQTNIYFNFIILLGAALSIRGNFFERPQIFSFLFFVLFFYLVSLYKYKEKNYLWLLPIIHVPWVNLHGGASLVGLVMILIFLVTEAFQLKMKINFFSKEFLLSEKKIKYLIKIFLILILISFLNPHTYKIYTHVFETITFESRQYISEFSPPKKADYFGIYGLILVLGLGSFLFNRKRDLSEFLNLAAFGYLATTAIRHLPFFVLLTVPVVSNNFNSLISRIRETKTFKRKKDESSFRIFLGKRSLFFTFLLLFGMGISLFFYIKSNEGKFKFGFGISKTQYPEKALQFLDKVEVRGNMFNTYGFGGYIIFRCYPKRKVFIDGRSLEYGADLVRKSILWSKPKYWEELVKKYKIDYAIILNGEKYECWYLDELEDWVLVYWDDISLIYVRKNGKNDEIIKKCGYQLLFPNKTSFQYINKYLDDPEIKFKVIAEIKRSMKENSRCVNAYMLLSYVYKVLGNTQLAIKENKKAIEINPQQTSLYENLGLLYLKNKEYNQAIKFYKKGISLGSRNSQVYCNLGTTYYLLGRPKKAIKYWRKTLKIEPGNFQARENLRLVGSKY